MRVPPDLAAAISGGAAHLGFMCSPDGTVTSGFDGGWGGGAYPPPTYLPWNILEVGNGDTYGYYWPIGREDGNPVVCTLMHDAWQILPVASSLAGCIRLCLGNGEGRRGELIGTARDFGIPIGDLAVSGGDDEADDDDEPASNGDAPENTVQDKLLLDPASPELRLVAAREAIARRQLDEAEEHLKVAIDTLPDYSDALALLAQVYRQQRDGRRTAETLMVALTSPLCFGGGNRKTLLQWLQRQPADTCPDSGDPLWLRRHDLTFAEGVKANADYAVYEDLVEAYHRAGVGVRAVRLRILTGELMGEETVSFRERYGWSDGKYRSLLRADLERAGLHARLAAVPEEP